MSWNNVSLSHSTKIGLLILMVITTMFICIPAILNCSMVLSTTGEGVVADVFWKGKGKGARQWAKIMDGTEIEIPAYAGLGGKVTSGDTIKKEVDSFIYLINNTPYNTLSHMVKTMIRDWIGVFLFFLIVAFLQSKK
jgi:hypothetical protein